MKESIKKALQEEADRNPELRRAIIKVGLRRVIHTTLITAVFVLLAILILK